MADMVSSTPSNADKGDPIRFVKGSYAGLTGWINKARKKKRNGYINVIVLLEDGTEKKTHVRKGSSREPQSSPSSYEEAILQQHPDIEKKMTELASMFAACNVMDDQKAAALFFFELGRAKTEQQELRGKARWRQVTYQA
jgi:hypothetical protein